MNGYLAFWCRVYLDHLIIFLNLRNVSGGRPSGAAVKCAHSNSAAQGLPVWIPGADMAPLLGAPSCGRRPMYKVEEDGHRC